MAPGDSPSAPASSRPGQRFRPASATRFGQRPSSTRSRPLSSRAGSVPALFSTPSPTEFAPRLPPRQPASPPSPALQQAPVAFLEHAALLVEKGDRTFPPLRF